MTYLAPRPWVPTSSFIQAIADLTAQQSTGEISDRLEALIERNSEIHERDCFNLNPATNVLNPRAEAVLSSKLGSRPSLGYPGDKYQTGLEAIEEIEVIAAELAAEIFESKYAEIRVTSCTLANLYGFMALTKPGDNVIVPGSNIGGDTSHHAEGCAGLYGLNTLSAPIDPANYTFDVPALRAMALEYRPTLITIGGSLNLNPHPVREIRAVADEIGAKVLFDAAHQSGMIAGKVWANPLNEGAHMMTMSTYKSLGGPAGGLILTNDAPIAQRLEGIAYPGLTANFDAAKVAALAITLLDWREYGQSYAREMVATAQALASALANEGLSVYGADHGFTRSHQFALNAIPLGGGQAASKRLRNAGFLTTGIGMPGQQIDGDLNGLRMGTSELVRWGMRVEDMPRLAALITEGLRTDDPETVALRTAAFRREFQELHYVR
ncbi:aminotransferase class I/II-fold pyridoxal phosphate-dependent enzyme [Caballeronia sp. 15715]|uniref:aminotransferase class I/II-fold pyridoxal phosphate-dependent enzyme n=1 Tax=Caballeronia sp. 15715 TaxID=3391030 RepID=UPI0039E439F8